MPTLGFDGETLSMGYEATDQTRYAVLGGLNAVSELSDGKLVRRLESAGRTVRYQMGTAVARQVLKTASH